MISDCIISPQHPPAPHQKAQSTVPASTILVSSASSFLLIPVHLQNNVSVSISVSCPYFDMFCTYGSHSPLLFLTAIWTNSSLPKAAVSWQIQLPPLHPVLVSDSTFSQTNTKYFQMYRGLSNLISSPDTEGNYLKKILIRHDLNQLRQQNVHIALIIMNICTASSAVKVLYQH